ncbi:MAG: redoxin domain-containing protein [Nitrospirae bacterium]|nr:redoxin domain-containing protein [Nitrospirota bacterium]
MKTTGILGGFYKKATLALLTSLIFLIISGAYTSGASALLQTGSQAPDFALRDLDGKEVALSHYSQQKAVVIFFWATWSANSPKALKRFENFRKKYKDRGIEIIAVNADNQAVSSGDVEKIRDLVKSAGVTFPVLIDRGLQTFRDYEVIALPSTVVVVEGKISYVLPGFPLVATEELFDYLSTLAGDKPVSKTDGGYKPKHDAIADANLAKGFVRKEKFALAYPLYKKAIEKDPKYMLPYVELSRLYCLEGRLQDAEETLRGALKVEPEHPAVVSELGNVLIKEKKIKEAIELLAKVVKEESYTPAVYYYAYALSQDGLLGEAFAVFEKAIRLNPFDPAIYKLRGEVLENNRMTKEAIADYKKSLELLMKYRD